MLARCAYELRLRQYSSIGHVVPKKGAPKSIPLESERSHRQLFER